MRRFVLAVLALIFAGLLGAGWYVYNKGFTKKWRRFVSEEFQKRGVELALRKLTFNPVRGFVAKGVKVYETRDRKRTLAVVDEVRLVINWANLIDGRAFIDALDLRDATLSLPVDPKESNGPKIDIRRMSGRLYLPPQQVVLSSFEAEVYGIRVTASGRAVNPQELGKKRDDDKDKRSPAALVARIVDELTALGFDAEPPTLDLRFSGDFAKPETVFAEAKLTAGRVRRGQWQLESLSLDALYRNERLTVRHLTATDATGELRAYGIFDPKAKGVEVQVRSTLDPKPIARAFGDVPVLSELQFQDPPEIDLGVSAVFGDTPAIQATGKVSLRRFKCKTVPFESFAADLVFDGERWAARNILLEHRSGSVSGDIMQVPGDFRARIVSTINPEAIMPFLPPKAATWFGQFRFHDIPAISVEARGEKPDPESLWANAVLRLGRASYRDIWAQSATATVRYADRKLTLDPMKVVRTEGSGEGALVFDFARHEVEVRDFRTNLHPHEIVWWIDRKLVKDIVPYRFGKKPPKLRFDGLVHTKGGDTTKLRVDIDAPQGMNYTFLKRDLHFPKVEARLFFHDHRMKIEKLEGLVMGGKIRGTLDISLEKTRPGHQAEVWLDDVDFATLTKLYFNYADSKGRLDARYAFTGKGDDARSMRGRGTLSVADGKVFAIPFLGPLSGILNGIVSGMGDDVARKGSASFTLENGVIETSDFLVEGSGFSMIGGGKLYFLDDKMDFDARINARGLPGVLLFPVSKLFEYTSTDSLSKPNWRPKIVPRL